MHFLYSLTAIKRLDYSASASRLLPVLPWPLFARASFTCASQVRMCRYKTTTLPSCITLRAAYLVLVVIVVSVGVGSDEGRVA
jgi:hypothetical protein